MRSLARLLVTALLVAMVPVKGMAAVGYMLCAHGGKVGPAAVQGHATGPSVGAERAVDAAHPGAQGHHDHHRHGQNMPAGERAAAAQGATAAHADQAAHGAHDAHGAAGCSHCGPCCAAAAPAAWAQVPAATPMHYPPPAAAEPGRFGEVTELPYRPPRPSLA